MRVGNDTILNNLKEGVVILKESTDEVLFVNNSAKKQFKVKPNESFQLNLCKKGSPINMQARCFAPIDLNQIKTENDWEKAHA